MNASVKTVAVVALLAASACAPRLQRVTVQPGTADAVIERSRTQGDIQREELSAQLGAVTANALATCAPAVCEAITRGEISLGMTQAQVLAATRTTAQSWDSRGTDRASTMMPRDEGRTADAVGNLAFINLQDGRVASYTYREAQGFRTVATAADATPAGRAAAQADALLRQGDEYAAAGRLDLALERYDQADVLRSGHPETTLRIASTLDKSLRPIEAILRYQLFIHQMELERIRARGEAAARIAEAIALAHQRIIVLERR
jgi:tetratricopeptide (TPR) repeat protein